MALGNQLIPVKFLWNPALETWPLMCITSFINMHYSLFEFAMLIFSHLYDSVDSIPGLADTYASSCARKLFM
jgi:hypothetical protein